jgi:hypothetical protein
MGTFTVTDSLGNTWTRRLSPLYDPGAANAGVEGAIFTTPQNGGTLTTGTTITVSFGSTSVTAKVWTLMEVSSGIGGVTPVYKNGGVGTGSATASPTVTSASIPNGQMIIGIVCNEQGTGQTPTGDSDTTNGSWSTMQTNEVGSTAAGQTIITQRKVVNAAGTQTYNPTLGTSSDVIAGWISIGEDISITTDIGALTAAGQAPTISTTDNQLITAALGTIALDGLAPGANLTDNQRVDAGLGQANLTGQAPTATASDHQIASPAAGQATLDGLAPTATASDNQVASIGLGEITITGLAPSPSASDNQTATADLGQLALAGFEPTITTAPSGIYTDPGTLTLTGYAPTITFETEAAPGTGQITVTGYAPYVSYLPPAPMRVWSGTEWKPVDFAVYYIP